MAPLRPSTWNHLGESTLSPGVPLATLVMDVAPVSRIHPSSNGGCDDLAGVREEAAFWGSACAALFFQMAMTSTGTVNRFAANFNGAGNNGQIEPPLARSRNSANMMSNSSGNVAFVSLDVFMRRFSCGLFSFATRCMRQSRNL